MKEYKDKTAPRQLKISFLITKNLDNNLNLEFIDDLVPQVPTPKKALFRKRLIKNHSKNKLTIK